MGNSNVLQTNLSPYYGDLKIGIPYDIEVQPIWPAWKSIGKGSYSVLSSTEIKFSGSYSFLEHSGDITIDLWVTGNNVGKMTLNGDTHDCTFSVKGDYLYVYASGVSGSIQLEFWHKGMWIGGSGAPYTLWIGRDI